MVGEAEKQVDAVIQAIRKWCEKDDLIRKKQNAKAITYRRHIDWKAVCENVAELGYPDLSLVEIKKKFSRICKTVRIDKPLANIISEAKQNIPKIVRCLRITGFQLFSKEIGKKLRKKNPSTDFSTISSIIGKKWRDLTLSKKKVYTDKADKINVDAGFTSSAVMARKRYKKPLPKVILPTIPPINLFQFYKNKLISSCEGLDEESKKSIINDSKKRFSKLNIQEFQKLDKEYRDLKIKFISDLENLELNDKKVAEGKCLKKKYMASFMDDSIMGYLFDPSKKKPVHLLNNSAKQEKEEVFHDTKTDQPKKCIYTKKDVFISLESSSDDDSDSDSDSTTTTDSDD